MLSNYFFYQIYKGFKMNIYSIKCSFNNVDFFISKLIFNYLLLISIIKSNKKLFGIINKKFVYFIKKNICVFFLIIKKIKSFTQFLRTRLQKNSLKNIKLNYSFYI